MTSNPSKIYQAISNKISNLRQSMDKSMRGGKVPLIAGITIMVLVLALGILIAIRSKRRP